MKDLLRINNLAVILVLVLLTGCGTTYMPASLKGTPKSQLAKVDFTSIVSIDHVNVEDYGNVAVYINPGKYWVSYGFQPPTLSFPTSTYSGQTLSGFMVDAAFDAAESTYAYTDYKKKKSEWSKGPTVGKCFLTFSAGRLYKNENIKEMIRITGGQKYPIKPSTSYAVSSSSYAVFTNKNSRIYHKRNCSKLNSSNLVKFYSPQEARNSGGKPCKDCNP